MDSIKYSKIDILEFILMLPWLFTIGTLGFGIFLPIVFFGEGWYVAGIIGTLWFLALPVGTKWLNKNKYNG